MRGVKMNKPKSAKEKDFEELWKKFMKTKKELFVSDEEDESITYEQFIDEYLMEKEDFKEFYEFSISEATHDCEEKINGFNHIIELKDKEIGELQTNVINKLQKENTELKEQLSCCKEQNLRLLKKDNVKELYALEKKYAKLKDKHEELEGYEALRQGKIKRQK